MEKFMLLFCMFLAAGFTGTFAADAKEGQTIEAPTPQAEHNWVEYSTGYDEIEAGTHEYTYWKNFIKRTRTCHIAHKIKTVVYYCDIHDHTKSETFLEEVIHSHRHGD